ncbi:ALH_1b_G0052100.mRNA.1.CDS.1 [Saccharomyces cerevisiae]|nr:ALH_1c_G0051770.mRNA.1.CDS.1 [Saccharomyces cerevisiae]CAI4831935.1 ALH_1b_G0052100.mRNA.1.CDS.1 [Saccharomyces cerevisiae]CAI5331600.1 AKR_HP2_G0048810.mRNA.1.CDS.1 [Saccharomyces cerevisiae]CAI6774673.1 AKR_HP2_G0048810.mRNA.1.CDS.1 [Saccharomyces cerevisiae]CAI6791227.1 AKR_HP1_G0050460.mRNA.1.CDS.1 [Saccharomyces cerevisiae]
MKLLFLNIIVVRRHLHCKSYRLSPWYIYIYIYAGYLLYMTEIPHKPFTRQP